MRNEVEAAFPGATISSGRGAYTVTIPGIPLIGVYEPDTIEPAWRCELYMGSRLLIGESEDSLLAAREALGRAVAAHFDAEKAKYLEALCKK